MTKFFSLSLFLFLISTIQISSFAQGCITNAPTSATVCSGNSAQFSVSASGTTISYQWQVDKGSGFVDVAAGDGTGGTTNSFTTVATTTAMDVYSYQVVVSSDVCTVTSNAVTLTVTPNNTVSAASSTPNVCINTAMTNITHATTGATGIGSATGLPTGVTAAWTANTITISGTPTASGTFNYTIPLLGGCGSVNATGTITVSPSNTVGAASSTPTLCINTALTDITHTTTGATGIYAASGLPAGVTAAWAANTITISGTPTASGTFNYSIPLKGGCGAVNATGIITVKANNTVTAASSTPTFCEGTAMTNITHTTTGATGMGAATGLPGGITAVWASNMITISGTPSTSGTYNYIIPLTGGCGAVNATGTIAVLHWNTVSSPSSTPSLCINTAMTNITHTTTGATGIGAATGLPLGVTATWAANTITISGTPITSGTYNYNIPLTGGCGYVNATGTITVKPNNTISLVSAAGTDAQTVCDVTAISNIAYVTTGATGAVVSGLPAGVSGWYSGGVFTISGVSTVASGNFIYTVSATGGCGTVTNTGTITITPLNTAWAPSSTPTLCINTAMTTITHTTTGASGIGPATGLPAGVTATWAANTITISGTPTASGTFNYSIPLTGGCGSVNAYGTIIVNPIPTATITTPAANLQYCQGGIGVTLTASPITGATYEWFNGGLSQGTPSGSNAMTNATAGSWMVKVTKSGCSAASTAVTVLVTPINTITLSSATGTDAQNSCVGTAILPIIYYTTTSTAGATFSGLPAGVTGNSVANSVTISGTPTESGTFNYTMTLPGGCGIVNATGTINVFALPTISSIPPAQNLTIGDPLNLEVTASGASLSYNWFKDNLSLSNLTNTYTVSSASIQDSGTYKVVVSDNGCSIADFIHVSITNIALQPSNSTVDEGTTQTFTIETYNIPASYQWQVDKGTGFENILDGVALKPMAGTTTYSGATTSQLTITKVSYELNNYKYRCLIKTNGGDEYSKEATLKVNKTTGVTKATSTKLEVYPNPAQDYITINNVYKESTIRIFNQQGVVMKTIVPSGNIISVADLNSGFYVIEIQNENQISRGHLIIK